MSIRKVKFAWKYRKYLWKYRAIIRHRREIAAVAAAGTALILGNCVYRYAAKRRPAPAEN